MVLQGHIEWKQFKKKKSSQETKSRRGNSIEIRNFL